MKKAITFRSDAALLEDARRCAVGKNRTLTNFHPGTGQNPYRRAGR